MAGPGASEATYAARAAICCCGELDLGLLDLDARPGERHPAGADLEVDVGGADADQASGPCLRALGVEAVTGGAVGQEQLLALSIDAAAAVSAPAARGLAAA